VEASFHPWLSWHYYRLRQEANQALVRPSWTPLLVVQPLWIEYSHCMYWKHQPGFHSSHQPITNAKLEQEILTFISWLRGSALMKNMAWLNFSGSYTKILALKLFYRFIFPSNIDHLLIHRRNKAVLRHYQNRVRSRSEYLKRVYLKSDLLLTK
jgi:hypothetical protein